MLIMLISWQPYALFILPTQANNRPPMSPSKLKTDMTRLKKLTQKSDRWEQSLAVSQSFVPSKLTSADIYGKLDRNLLNDEPIYEIFVRKQGKGLWHRLKDISVDSSLQNIAESVREGGLSAEMSRPQLERGISASLLGSGMGGDKVLFLEIQQVLSQFKKTKIQEMEIGYKFIDDDIIWMLTALSSHSSTKKSFMNESIQSIINNQTMSLANSTLHCPKTGLLIYERLKRDIQEHLCTSEVREIRICSDGSATQILASNDSFLVSAGVVACALSYQNEMSRQMQWKIVNDGSVVTSPLDAEILGGLLAIFLREIVMTTSPDIPVTFMSDSKSLLRLIRQANATSFNSTESMRSTFHRSLMRQSSSPWTSRWVAGHPERREANSSLWSLDERLIFSADKLSKLFKVDFHADSSPTSIRDDIDRAIVATREISCMEVMSLSSI